MQFNTGLAAMVLWDDLNKNWVVPKSCKPGCGKSIICLLGVVLLTCSSHLQDSCPRWRDQGSTASADSKDPQIKSTQSGVTVNGKSGSEGRAILCSCSDGVTTAFLLHSRLRHHLLSLVSQSQHPFILIR